MKFAFYSSKCSLILKIQGNELISAIISTFDIISSVETSTTPNCNNESLRNSIAVLIHNFASKLPQIYRLNDFLKELKDNEYFFANIWRRELTIGEMINIRLQLLSFNNPNFDLVKHTKASNDLFKNISENYRISSPSNKNILKIGESDKNLRICRFCRKDKATGAKFSTVAHAISESLGNSKLILNEECVECNSYFGRSIERDFLILHQFYCTTFSIPNKNNKIPTLTGKNFEYSNLGNDNTSLNLYSANDNEKLKLNGKIILQNIYKTLAKFALSILDTTDLNPFDKTIEWIRNPIFKDKLPKVAQSISNPSISQPRIMVYLRSSDDVTLPYAVGEFHFACLIYVFIIPTFSNLEPDFTNQDHFSKFWNFFKHFSMTEEFKFIDFSDSIEKNVEFKLNFECEDKE